MSRVAHSYIRILYLNKKESYTATCSHTDESHKDVVYIHNDLEWKKQTQNNTYHVIPFVRVQKHLKVTYWLDVGFAVTF